MAFDVNQFRAQIQFDGARNNLFEVAMVFPAFSDTSAAVKLTFMCKASQLPGSQVNHVTVPYFGREVKLAGNRTFQDWDITVINDEDFVVRRAFELWMNGLNSHRFNLRNVGAGTPDSYTTNPSITQFGKTGNIIHRYDFVGAFPTAISPIEVAWDANDRVEDFNVTLAYQWWEIPSDSII